MPTNNSSGSGKKQWLRHTAQDRSAVTCPAFALFLGIQAETRLVSVSRATYTEFTRKRPTPRRLLVQAYLSARTRLPLPRHRGL